MTTDRDPVVGGVLDLLEVPPPADGFWPELAERLRTESPLALVGRSRPPGAAARRRRILAGLAAAAVAAAAVLMVGALQDDGQDVETIPADPPSSTTSTPDAPTARVPAVQAAEAWTDAIDQGDGDGAWALVGPQSRASIGGRAAFDELVRSALREGWGAWADQGDRHAIAFQGVEDLVLVVFAGQVAQESEVAGRVLGLLVAEHDGAWLVEPFVPGPSLDLIDLPQGAGNPPAIGSDGVVGLALPADAAVAVAVDGLAVPEDRLVRDESGAVVGASGGDLPRGVHTIAVGIRQPGGALASNAQPFAVP